MELHAQETRWRPKAELKFSNLCKCPLHFQEASASELELAAAAAAGRTPSSDSTRARGAMAMAPAAAHRRVSNADDALGNFGLARNSDFIVLRVHSCVLRVS